MTQKYRSVLLALVLVLTLTAAPAAAASSGFWSNFTSNSNTPHGIQCFLPGNNVSFLDCNAQLVESVSASVAHAKYKVAHVSHSKSSDQKQASKYATSFATDYNKHNASIENYANKRFSGDASKYDTIEIDFDVGDAKATRYMVADANGSTFSNSRIVNSTNRTVDKTIGLHDFAAAKATSEFDRFRSKYVAKHKNINHGLMVRMAQHYGTLIDLPNGVKP